MSESREVKALQRRDATTELTRRRFFQQTSIGVGMAMAGAAVWPNPTLPHEPPNAPAGALPSSSLSAPIVVHVRDVATAEIAVLVGTQEIVYRDAELVARLLQTAGPAARTEG
jgi:hypothetical protein